ncbi:MAG TPA: hypothetical protein VIP70_03905 [Nitrososphaeraceae archaeon]|jgi:hypothetical protein
MNQKNLVVTTAAMLVALIATVAIGTTPLAFAQVSNRGIAEDDDTTNITSSPTKVKDSANCNISGFANECEQESQAGIETEEGEEALIATPVGGAEEEVEVEED